MTAVIANEAGRIRRVAMLELMRATPPVQGARARERSVRKLAAMIEREVTFTSSSWSASVTGATDLGYTN